ncbi:hypothetical protein DY218_10385 [Streptomyces triticagri]|uniref:Uncharacterized protein n=1 Tax=Streptomyces triticagri TaxID=2293568 RepID=A0A372M7C9_9ACTN|nr:hypothetical protein [Streptomyces triticagri]RFU86771.1 hypothetical protein DY218_10385 [Streptomyces triticagri]
MRADLVWWSLDDTAGGQTVDSLSEALSDGDVREWTEVPGLAAKFWLSDRAGNRWGAVMIWSGERPPNAELPPNRAAELIGAPPTFRTAFDVEAVACGPDALAGAPSTRGTAHA